MTADRLRPWTWPLVVGSGLLLSLRFGFNFGMGNHNTYLLHALRLVDPTLLTHDWLASSTQDYHPVFTRFAALLIGLDPTGWLVAWCNVIFITLGAVAVFLIVREVIGDRLALPAYLLVVAFMGVGSTYSVSGSYLFSMTFQPSTVAAVAFLFAVVYFLRQQFLRSGWCLAVAGAFHLNFAVLAFPLFMVSHLFLGRRWIFWRLFAQLGPVLVPLAVLSPLLLGQARSLHVDEARFIFQHVVSPQHYLPLTYLSEFAVYFAWCGLGALAGWEVLHETSVAKRLRSLWLSSLILVSLATLLTTVVFLPAVSQLYFWRLAPLAVLLAQVLAAAGFVKHMFSDETHMQTAARTALLLCCTVLIWFTFRYHYGEFRSLQYGLLIALAVAFYVRPWLIRIPGSQPRVLTGVAVAAIWLVGALVPAAGMASRSNLISGLPAAEAELYRWAATTPEASVFLIPPQLENFRFQARRAIVVDFKSTPVDPEQLLEWYRRMGMVCGKPNAAGLGDMVEGYAGLDSARIEHVSEIHPFDYVVVLKDQPFAGMGGFEAAFENNAYRLYRRTIP